MLNTHISEGLPLVSYIKEQGALFFQVSNVTVFLALGLAGARDGTKFSDSVWELYPKHFQTESKNGWLSNEKAQSKFDF